MIGFVSPITVVRKPKLWKGLVAMTQAHDREERHTQAMIGLLRSAMTDGRSAEVVGSLAGAALGAEVGVYRAEPPLLERSFGPSLEVARLALRVDWPAVRAARPEADPAQQSRRLLPLSRITAAFGPTR